ncbi:MAG: SMP-30/gluconolactonase/LRE family protein [Anaerolineae bacterium]|nr:SMP-30/gluconolactonase/LRE family protein [Anaerolineae bacterium]
MILRIQRLPRAQRTLIFIAFLVGGVLLIVAITVGLILLSFNTGRDQSVALVEGVTAGEFAVLPDDDAYPATVAVGPDGAVYTASYVSGAVWSITPDGSVRELPGTRAAFEAVSGLAVGPDGTLYVIDLDDANPLTLGGEVRRIDPQGSITPFAVPGDERGFLLPDDLALDAQGRVYVSDRGRAEVWRFEADGSGGIAWWTPPEAGSGDDTRPAPTGLSYDSAHDALIITDSNLNTIYRVSITTGEGEQLYRHVGQEYVPGLDGVTTAPDGTIYAAALEQNGLVRLKDGDLEYIAGVFRGLSDVAYFEGKIYAANFDSFSLLVPLVHPRLPFALDVIELPAP